jgi:hypothetical protein
MGPDLTRRQLLGSGLTASLAGLAGCFGEGITEGEIRAEVVSVRPDELDEPVEGTVDVTALVANHQKPAELEIIIEAVNLDKQTDEGRQAITASTSLVRSFDRQEQREVTTEIDPGPEADGLLGRVEPA